MVFEYERRERKKVVPLKSRFQGSLNLSVVLKAHDTSGDCTAVLSDLVVHPDFTAELNFKIRKYRQLDCNHTQKECVQ